MKSQRTGKEGGGSRGLLKRNSSRVRAFWKHGLLVVMVVALATSAASAGPYTQLIVFGDSLSDVGNEHELHGNVLSPDYNYRNSNGPLWVDHLAAYLGTPSLTCSTLGGANYAYGGAETVNESWAPNLGTQVTSYLSPAGVADPGALYIVWMGSNDFLKTYPRTGAFPTTADLATWRNQVSNAVSALYSAGARNFIVPNLVPLGNVPAMSVLPSSYQSYLNSLVSGYNTDLFQDLDVLEGSLAGLSIQKLDTYSLLNDVLADPGKHGLTDVVNSAQFTPGANPDTYLFWDDVHPTARGHELLASFAIGQIPEPSAIAMLVIGAFTLLGWAGVRSRR